MAQLLCAKGGLEKKSPHGSNADQISFGPETVHQFESEAALSLFHVLTYLAASRGMDFGEWIFLWVMWNGFFFGSSHISVFLKNPLRILARPRGADIFAGGVLDALELAQGLQVEAIGLASVGAAVQVVPHLGNRSEEKRRGGGAAWRAPDLPGSKKPKRKTRHFGGSKQRLSLAERGGR